MLVAAVLLTQSFVLCYLGAENEQQQSLWWTHTRWTNTLGALRWKRSQWEGAEEQESLVFRFPAQPRPIPTDGGRVFWPLSGHVQITKESRITWRPQPWFSTQAMRDVVIYLQKKNKIEKRFFFKKKKTKPLPCDIKGEQGRIQAVLNILVLKQQLKVVFKKSFLPLSG